MDRLMKTEVLAFAGYQEFEAAADRTAVKIKEGYMEMGYILKMARDTDILRESEYTGYMEFAEKRYGLDQGTVSRYIRIVERFSEGGNSHVLMDNYKNMGFAKLSIMLHMPDAIAEELMDSLSKTEVQAIREELEAEEQVSDIELAIEQVEAEEKKILPPVEGNMLSRAVWQMGREHHEIYRKVWKAFEKGDTGSIKDILAPQGDAVITVRIPGTGRFQIFIKSDICVVNLRTQEKERYSEEDMIEELRKICPVAGMFVEEAYKSVYDEDMEPVKEPEKKAEVAPVQQKKEKRKESKVTKAKAEKPNPAAVVEEEQLPGQMSVEDYEGIVPDATYEEVRDGDSDADQEGEPCTGDIDGVSGGAGDPADDVECGQAERAEGSEIQSDYAADGTSESGGSKEDTRTVEDIWMGIYQKNSEVSKYLTVWESQHNLMERDMLQKLYDMTVAMAAGFEKLLMEDQE